MLGGKNIVVLDLEILRSADDCLHCGASDQERCACYAPIGWDNKALLGLSIGCYWSYLDGALHWFDQENLESTMRFLVETQPLLVSFNGIAFDFPLMRGLLRREADCWAVCGDVGRGEALTRLCDTFKDQCATSYDILAELWRVAGRFGSKGLNTLDALCAANGIPRKEMTGVMAPRLWKAGRCAEVIEYNYGDVLRTKRLFEMSVAGHPIRRSDGNVFVLSPPLNVPQASA
jgi:hypothetical protein